MEIQCLGPNQQRDLAKPGAEPPAELPERVPQDDQGGEGGQLAEEHLPRPSTSHLHTIFFHDQLTHKHTY